MLHKMAYTPFHGTSQYNLFYKKMKKVLAMRAILWDSLGMETRGAIMETGTQKYTLPNTDIVVSVDYEIRGTDIYFVSADIGENTLDCTVLGVTIDTTEKYDLMRTVKQLSLKDWYQVKLDHDSEEILERHNVVVVSDLEEHFSQRGFV